MTSNDRTPDLPTAADLRRLVRQAPKTPGRQEAIAGLVELKPRGLNRYLRDLALDETLDQPMRLEAVTALGRETTRSALDGLRATMEVDDPTVRQRAVTGLGKVGTADDIELLKAIRTGNRVTQQVLRTAKLMLSYRHGLGEYRLDVPSRLHGAGDGEAIEIEVRRLGARAEEELVVAAPGVELVLEGAPRLQCGSNEYLLALTAEHPGADMAALTERQGLPAVLLTRNIETGRFEPGYYFATDPATATTFHIHGLRGSGRHALYGTGTIEDGIVHFEVRATETPLEPPVTVTGTYAMASGAIDFEVAMSEPRLAARQRRLRSAPRVQQGPVR